MKQKQEIRLPAAVVPLDGQSPWCQPTLARQTLRRLGFFEILLYLKHEYPLAPRPKLREAAHALNKVAWDGRDKEVVKKIMGK
jgi:hypothetical protein